MTRIVHDASYPDGAKYASLQPLVLQQQAKSNLCKDPLSNWMILWYFFVFQAIIFYFT